MNYRQKLEKILREVSWSFINYNSACVDIYEVIDIYRVMESIVKFRELCKEYFPESDLELIKFYYDIDEDKQVLEFNIDCEEDKIICALEEILNALKHNTLIGNPEYKYQCNYLKFMGIINSEDLKDIEKLETKLKNIQNGSTF